MGGYTHGNHLHIGEICNNVASLDESSAYPYVMVSQLYPMSKGELITIKDKADFIENLKYYHAIFTATFYNIDETTLRGTQRTKEVADARHVANYLIRRLTNLSTPDIGKEFGGRDHTTVLNSINKIESELKNGNTDLQNHLRDITANINSCL